MIVNLYAYSIINGVLQNWEFHIKVEYLQLYVVKLPLKVAIYNLYRALIVSCQVSTGSVTDEEILLCSTKSFSLYCCSVFTLFVSSICLIATSHMSLFFKFSHKPSGS